jgi:hypothetical protein
MKAAVGAVTSFSEEKVLVLAEIFALLGTCRYESKVFERRLAEDKVVFTVCGRLTGKVVLIVLDLGFVNGTGCSDLGLRCVGDTGEMVLRTFGNVEGLFCESNGGCRKPLFECVEDIC